jgi:ABC-type polysaccharide/polyol phosphate export permease
MFYASAVFFPVELVPERYRFVVEYNPIAIYIQTVREALTHKNIINLDFILISLAVAIVLVLVGRLYFKHSVKRVAEHF